MDGLAAFVLAGGKSSRMGHAINKSFMLLEGRSLLDRALALAASVTPSARIVGPQKLAAYGDVVEDVYADHGPLAGIHTALASSPAELNLILAVDMPFVDSRFLAYLVSEARKCRAWVTVPRTDRGWQPLCAVYRRQFAAAAEPALREGRNKIDALFAQVETRVIEEDELIAAGFSAAMFRNLNTPQEFAGAAEAMRENRPPGKLS